MRFLHTADWQIGKPFIRFGEKSERLRAARLDAIENIGQLAISENIEFVLVAGDVFDCEAPSRHTLTEPIERMKNFAHIKWHLLPGNHDPHRAGGIWDRFLSGGIPNNLIVHVESKPFELDSSCWLLPAPLTTKTETRDLTLSMEISPTPEGSIRIGLAHGSVVNFAPEGDASNPIDPSRPEKAGLSYLALGDWHRTMCINDRVWYAGTPEPDRHNSQEVGKVLLVSLKSQNSLPQIEERSVGTFCWRSIAFHLDDPQELHDFEILLRRDFNSLSRLILQLRMIGAVSLADRKVVNGWLERFNSAVCHLDVDDSELRVRPDESDLESIDFDGVLRQVAERLKKQINAPGSSESDRRVAEDALVTLFLEGTDVS